MGMEQARAHRGTRTINRLSALKAQRLMKAGRHADGGNLYLDISMAGARHWVFIYRRHGKRTELGLGGYPGTSLHEARGKAHEHREALRQGNAPQARAKPILSPARTLGDAITEFIQLRTSKWRTGTRREWLCSLQSARLAALRAMPIDAIATAEIVPAIRAQAPIARANTLRRIAAVCDWATARGFRSGANPAKINIADYLAVMPHIVTHRKAMPFGDCPAFIQGLSGQSSFGAMALLFQILCCVRPTEARLAQWSEIDFSTAIWTIPASRMKAHREHRIPLSRQALELLQRLASLRTSAFIFPGRSCDTLSCQPINEICAGAECQAHGFRSSFADWSAHHEYSYELTELSLAHAFGSTVSRAYRRTDLIEQRRELLQRWANFLLP
jgi:integrase